MPEPTSSGVLAATSAGLTVLGVVTGLHPPILLAGLAGGWWAQTYEAPMPILKRTAVAVMSSIIAGYLTPAVSAGVASSGLIPKSVTIDLLQLPVALIVGLLAYRWLGPTILRVAKRKAEAVEK
ncbi:hypothetical protein [Azonexus sp. IMCC34839]|uniref:hypothetical protein n=1 Tax=Azonexus sp. IMCC34839 TaxID=3133695 RepID=UPI00399A45DB